VCVSFEREGDVTVGAVGGGWAGVVGGREGRRKGRRRRDEIFLGVVVRVYRWQEAERERENRRKVCRYLSIYICV